ncbi:MAG: hypothetical protein FWD89_04955, partial [Firmicutes bacterium]|nr:hypothetical protein [Bacillota bacterium]
MKKFTQILVLPILVIFSLLFVGCFGDGDRGPIGPCPPEPTLAEIMVGSWTIVAVSNPVVDNYVDGVWIFEENGNFDFKYTPAGSALRHGFWVVGENTVSRSNGFGNDSTNIPNVTYDVHVYNNYNTLLLVRDNIGFFLTRDGSEQIHTGNAALLVG